LKNIFKKNQIVITALAIMIAVAGYLNYSGTKLDSTVDNTTVSGTTAEGDYADISDEDILAENSLSAEEESAEETTETDDNGNDSALIDINSLDNELDEADIDEDDNIDADAVTPGEAVLTSTTTSLGFAAEAKVTREQIRSKNKETLLEIINNANITDDQKQNAINSMLALTDTAEREAAAELLLEAKGFADVVVSITDDTADVVLNMTEVTDAQRAQIEDIMKRKTGVSAENIVITPYSVED